MKLDIELMYLPRSKWPKKIVAKFHEHHVKLSTRNPKCPLCVATPKPRRTTRPKAGVI